MAGKPEGGAGDGAVAIGTPIDDLQQQPPGASVDDTTQNNLNFE